MERERAIEIIKTVGAEKPHADIDAFCEFTSLSTAAFDDVCERFRNRDIWQQDAAYGKYMTSLFLIGIGLEIRTKFTAPQVRGGKP